MRGSALEASSPESKTLGASAVKLLKDLTGLARIGNFDAIRAPKPRANGREKGPESISEHAHKTRWFP
jgi:hypothetical protein